MEQAKAKTIKLLTRTILIVFIFLLFSVWLNLAFWLELKSHTLGTPCRLLSSYEEAKEKLDNGHTELDTNHDGIPCQSYFPEDIKEELLLKKIK